MTRLNRRLTAYLGAGTLSVTLAATLALSGAVGTPPCAEEDSPGPCYWNASTMGNDVGLSFYVDAQQTVHYDGGN